MSVEEIEARYLKEIEAMPEILDREIARRGLQAYIDREVAEQDLRKKEVAFVLKVAEVEAGLQAAAAKRGGAIEVVEWDFHDDEREIGVEIKVSFLEPVRIHKAYIHNMFFMIQMWLNKRRKRKGMDIGGYQENAFVNARNGLAYDDEWSDIHPHINPAYGELCWEDYERVKFALDRRLWDNVLEYLFLTASTMSVNHWGRLMRPCIVEGCDESTVFPDATTCPAHGFTCPSCGFYIHNIPDDDLGICSSCYRNVCCYFCRDVFRPDGHGNWVSDGGRRIVNVELCPIGRYAPNPAYEGHIPRIREGEPFVPYGSIGGLVKNVKWNYFICDYHTVRCNRCGILVKTDQATTWGNHHKYCPQCVWELGQRKKERENDNGDQRDKEQVEEKRGAEVQADSCEPVTTGGGNTYAFSVSADTGTVSAVRV